MTNKQAIKLIELLKQVNGSISYDGDASVQVLLPLVNGDTLRIGITDEDVAPTQGLWFDINYKFNIKRSTLPKPSPRGYRRKRTARLS